ncbi:MAG: 1,4-dihydroxy-2-naphthoate polyprenyltransferase [Ilumatobacteraceae bacterium]
MTSSDNSSSLGWKKWVMGSRPRTLPAAVVPVAVGAACASVAQQPAWWRGGLALVVSLALQVGVNYANDYSDGVRGTDNDRVGPLRLVGSGVASARAVKRAAFMCFGVAAIAGLILALVTTLWLLVVGVAAIIAAWTYTGGPRPYGYAGLGEVFVFLFFGVVATIGTEFVIAEDFSVTGAVASVAVGSIACALLVINNLRDISGDTVVGKKTLAVKMGDVLTRKFFAALIFLAFVAVVVTSFTAGPFAILGLVGVIALRPAIDAVSRGAKGRDLIPVLGIVGKGQLVLGISYTLGLVLALSAL